jgi:hypothetical protein
MTRYLIEVPHENSKEACLKAIRVFLQTGSHFLSNADWGCRDDEHKAWIMVELDSKEEATAILPPLYRPNARVITLDKFTMADVEGTMQQHNE